MTLCQDLRRISRRNKGGVTNAALKRALYPLMRNWEVVEGSDELGIYDLNTVSELAERALREKSNLDVQANLADLHYRGIERYEKYRWGIEDNEAFRLKANFTRRWAEATLRCYHGLLSEGEKDPLLLKAVYDVTIATANEIESTLPDSANKLLQIAYGACEKAIKGRYNDSILGGLRSDWRTRQSEVQQRLRQHLAG